jgi:hypothetical protein
LVYPNVITYKSLGNFSSSSITPINYSRFFGYLPALAIHNDIFITGLRDVKKIYQIEIPPQANYVKLKMKKTKLNLPIFYQPECPTNQPRNPISILEDLYGKAGGKPITLCHGNEPYYGRSLAPWFRDVCWGRRSIVVKERRRRRSRPEYLRGKRAALIEPRESSNSS